MASRQSGVDVVRDVLQSAESVYESHYEPWESLGGPETVEQEMAKVAAAREQLDELANAAQGALDKLRTLEWGTPKVDAHSEIADLEKVLGQ